MKEVNKRTGPVCQLFFKFREKHVLLPSAWVWRLSNLPSQGSRSGDEDEPAWAVPGFPNEAAEKRPALGPQGGG